MNAYSVRKHVTLVLDRSGSMASIADVAVSNYNEQVQQLKADATDGVDLRVGLVTFNGAVFEHLWDVPAAQLELADPAGYQPDGSTNIYDALGHVIDKWQAADHGPEDQHLVVLISDGAHNVAGKWSQARLRSAITELQGTNRWTFTFLGCDPGSFVAMADAGIPVSNMAVWSNRSRKIAAHSNKASSAALGAWTKSADLSAKNYYSDADDRAMNFAALTPETVSLDSLNAANSHSTGGISRSLGARGMVLRSSGGPTAQSVSGGDDEALPIGCSSVASAASVLDDAALPEPEILKGTADVFGKSTRVS